MLATAAYHGKQQVVKTLLEEKAVDPNVLDGGGWSPLQAACYGDHSGPSVTSLLAHPKTDPNVQPRTGCSLLFVVAQSGRVEAMRALLEDTRTSVDVPREDDGMTVLRCDSNPGLVTCLVLTRVRVLVETAVP